jgi:hypothetical protein
MRMIFVEDKTLAAVLMTEGFNPMSENENGVYFVYDEELHKICAQRFERSQYILTDILTF